VGKPVVSNTGGFTGNCNRQFCQSTYHSSQQPRL